MKSTKLPHPLPREVHPGVVVVDMMLTPYDQRVLRDAILSRKFTHPVDGRPNSMNKYGFVLEGHYFNRWVKWAIQKYVQPITRYYLAPKMRKLSLRAYAMTVEYDVKKQRSLARHFDSSDVTLNVCVDGKFKGGDLILYDRKSDGRYVLKQKLGQAVVHLGRHDHRALPIKSGTRTNLVLWCKQVKRKK